jgi:integrase/recombinase XerD
MKRSLLVFESAIKSDATRKQYSYYLHRFLKWSKIADHDELLSLKDSFLQTLLEDYLFYLKKSISPNSIAPIFAALELFFSMNDKVLNFKKIRKMFPQTVKKSGHQAWTTEDIQKMLRFTKDPRNRALVLFLSSVGCRIGAVPDIKIKHTKQMPDGCRKITFYVDSNEEYVGFLTPEANKALTEYLELRQKDGEVLTDESPLFRKKYQVGSSPVKKLTEAAAKHIMFRLISGMNCGREKDGQRFNIQIDHGFRKRFNTILKLITDVNPNIAEKLMGHKNGLDGVYFVPTEADLFTEFKKAIIEITIDPAERLQAKLNQTEKEKSEIENIKEKFELDHQLLQMLAHSVQGTGVQLVTPDGKPYKIDPEVIKKIMKDYVEPVGIIDESLAKNQIEIKV